MAATLTTLNAALDRIWTQRRLEEQLYQDTPFLSKIEKRTRYSIGELARVPLHVSRNGGYTALPDGGGTLNTAGNQGIDKAEFTYTHHHQPIALQGDVIDQTSSNNLSVANAVDVEVNGALTDLKRNLQRQLFLNGDALIVAAKTSDTNDVDLNATTGPQAIDRGWIYVGMQVDVGTTTVEDDIVNGSTVTAVGADQFTVAAGAVTTEDSSDYVSHKDSRDGTTSYEMNGLRNLVAANTVSFGGLTGGEWGAASVNTTAQPLTLSLLLQQDQAIHQQTGSKADFVLTGLKQERKFYELLQQQVRFGSDSSLAAGAQDSPEWNGKDIIADPDCWDEDLYMGQLKHLFIVALDRPYWQDKVTGGQKLVWAQGTDSYVGKLSYRIELATNRRNAFTRLGALS